MQIGILMHASTSLPARRLATIAAALFCFVFFVPTCGPALAKNPTSAAGVRIPTEASPSPDQTEDTAETPIDVPASGTYLWFDPPRLRYCGAPVERIAIKVFWDVSSLDVDEVKIELDRLNGSLFARGGAQGQAETGEWVTNGKRFLLVSPKQGKVIAEKTFQLLPCNSAKYPFKPE